MGHIIPNAERKEHKRRSVDSPEPFGYSGRMNRFSFKKILLISAFFTVGTAVLSGAEEMGSDTGDAMSSTVLGNFVKANDEKISKLEQLHAQADDLIVKNQFPEAIKAFDEILLLGPDDEIAYTEQGRAYMILGDFEHAREAFANALHINPTNPQAMEGLQKIMDPDGVRGMISAAQIEAEGLGEEEETSPTPRLVKTAVQSSVETVSAPKTPPSPVFVSEPDEVYSEPTANAAFKLSPEASIAREEIPAASLTPTTVEADRSTPAPTSEEIQAQTNGWIKTIQMALKKTGLYVGPADGVMRPDLRQAIKKFQSMRGLKTDGIVGPKTWALLKPYSSVPSENKAS